MRKGRLRSHVRTIAVGAAAVAMLAGGYAGASSHGYGYGYGGEGEDTTPPRIYIDAPAQGAVYRAFSFVRARYECSDGSDGTGSGVDFCDGDVPQGAFIDTKPGFHRFRVRAEDGVGNRSQRTVSYRACFVPDLEEIGIGLPGNCG